MNTKSLQFLSFFIFLFLANKSTAQDVILDKDGNEILSIVKEILTTEIKYKKWENKEGPTYTIPKSDVFKIKFKNGTSELISAGTSTSNTNSLSSGNQGNNGGGSQSNSSVSGSTFSPDNFYYNTDFPFNGVYQLNTQNNQIQNIEKNPSHTNYVPSFGWVPPTFIWEVPGRRSSVRIPSGAPVSFIAKIIEPGMSAGKIRFVKFTNRDKKSGNDLSVRRLVVMVNASVDNKWSSYADNNLGEFDFHSTPDFLLNFSTRHLGNGIYELIPNNLPPGEYGFSLGNNFFTFGID